MLLLATHILLACSVRILCVLTTQTTLIRLNSWCDPVVWSICTRECWKANKNESSAEVGGRGGRGALPAILAPAGAPRPPRSASVWVLERFGELLPWNPPSHVNPNAGPSSATKSGGGGEGGGVQMDWEPKWQKKSKWLINLVNVISLSPPSVGFFFFFLKFWNPTIQALVKEIRVP